MSTTSEWKLPLHSSDSEHPEQARRNSRGRGLAVAGPQTEGESPLAQGNPVKCHPPRTTVTASTNPFRTRKGL